MDDLPQLTLRLGCAMFFGAVLGLNRGLRQKPAGMRTHALVALGAAYATWMVLKLSGGDPIAVSRVMQGTITGIGFIGAGVIMHNEEQGRVAGLTTAASVWMATILGLGCGAGMIIDTAVALAMALVLLLISSSMQERMALALEDRKRRQREARRGRRRTGTPPPAAGAPGPSPRERPGAG